MTPTVAAARGYHVELTATHVAVTAPGSVLVDTADNGAIDVGHVRLLTLATGKRVVTVASRDGKASCTWEHGQPLPPQVDTIVEHVRPGWWPGDKTGRRISYITAHIPIDDGVIVFIGRKTGIEVLELMLTDWHDGRQTITVEGNFVTASGLPTKRQKSMRWDTGTTLPDAIARLVADTRPGWWRVAPAPVRHPGNPSSGREVSR